MKSDLQIIALLAFVMFYLNSCLSTPSNETHNEPTSEQDTAVQPKEAVRAFPIPEIPLMITDPQERAIYLSNHYWDLFPFEDTMLISIPAITEQGFVDYIQLLNLIPYPKAEISIQISMNKAKVGVAMYNHFISLFEKYLYEPNSPFRNDELYIPVVANALKSELLSNVKQEIYGFQQKMILKNRVGTVATDFVYTLDNGNKNNMYALKSDYLILFFTNPDCPTCETVTREMDNSATLRNVFSLNSDTNSILTVLSIYPDSNIDEWRKALPNMPQQNWINTYDDGTQVTNKRLYDIKAIPTLYLLARDKKVILKDTSLEEIENYFMKVR